MTLKEFKNEFRLVCTDTWGTAIDAWFECAGHMYERSIQIPAEWEYRPGLFGGTEEDNYFFPLFTECTETELQKIGGFLFRYCEYLRFKGINY